MGSEMGKVIFKIDIVGEGLGLGLGRFRVRVRVR